MLPVPVLIGPGRGHRFDAAGPGMALRLMAGRYEPTVMAFLRDSLRDARTFVDVGAHTGYFVRVALRTMSPSGRVFAFEPDVRCLSQLRAIAPARVSVHHEALGRANATADLISSGRACSRLHDRPSIPLHASVSTVQVRDLDSLVRAGEIPRPEVMKIDVEGAEVDVLAGASNTLDSLRAIAVECHSMPLLYDVLDCLLERFASLRVTAGGDFLGPPTLLALRSAEWVPGCG